jgi:hypothetical protein
MVKVGYLCMGQMMMWDNVVMFPFHYIIPYPLSINSILKTIIKYMKE